MSPPWADLNDKKTIGKHNDASGEKDTCRVKIIDLFLEQRRQLKKQLLLSRGSISGEVSCLKDNSDENIMSSDTVVRMTR